MKYLVLLVALFALAFFGCTGPLDTGSLGGSDAGTTGGACAYECVICCPDEYELFACHEGENINSQADCRYADFTEISPTTCFHSSRAKYYPDHTCSGLCSTKKCNF